MSDKENPTGFNPFANRSLYLASYQGSGTLTLDTQEAFTCTFEVGQMKTGNIFLICRNMEPVFPSFFFATTNHPALSHFAGKTSEGYQLSSTGNIVVAGRISATEVTCVLRTLIVEMKKNSVPYQVHFGLTNVLMMGAFSLRLEHAGIITELFVKPVENYQDIVDHIRPLKIVDITCEVSGFLTEQIKAEQLVGVVDNLCYLLSVAQGFKINWLYQTFSDSEGTCLSKVHESYVAKAYKAQSLIPSHNLPAFMEGTYGAYVTNRERYQLNTRIIDLYLDALAEGDYLQPRGMKLATALEAIKAVFTNLETDPVKETILTRSAFERLRKKLCEQISPLLEGLEDGSAKTFCDKLPELNRRSFNELLDDIFARINFQIDEEEKKRFIRCRNKLVHEGRFYCEAEAQKAHAVPDHQQMVQEYFFMVSVLDRVILKLLGYQGIYKDPYQHTEKWLA